MTDNNTTGYKRFEVRKAPRQRRSRSTVESIKQAALELAAQEGFTELNTTQIAERAGVSKGSLYQYFSNREAIFMALFEDATTGMAEVMKALYLQILDLPPHEGIPKAIRRHLELFRQHELIFLTLPGQVPQLRLASQPITYESMIARFTRTYIRERIPEISDSDLERRAFFIHEIVKGCIASFVSDRPAKISDRSFVEDLSEIIIGYSLKGAQ
ncbi:MAG: TetR/AcrR family transcriptional regulator [Porticoccaceae bacterium]